MQQGRFMIWQYFLYAFIALFPIVNPIAMAPLFYSITQEANNDQRGKLAAKIALYGTVTLLAALLLGPFLLHFFGLRAADLRIAGGLVLFSVAWKMLNAPRESEKEPHKVDDNNIMNLAFYPLTIPVTIGGASIAITIALATQAHKDSNMIDQYISIALAIIAIFILVYICYRYSSVIFKVLGENGSKVVSSLSAFILLAIGVSVTLGGLQIIFPMMGK